MIGPRPLISVSSSEAFTLTLMRVNPSACLLPELAPVETASGITPITNASEVIIIDGKKAKACVSKLSQLDGKSIVTIEGLSEREKAVYT